MTIKAGDRLPLMTLFVMADNKPKSITINELFAGKKVVLFAVPGAFTPGCTKTHLPGFITHAEQIKACGVDNIICVAVNDIFVMDAWSKQKQAGDIIMLADGDGAFTQAIGMVRPAGPMPMGIRSQRYAMIVNDGVVEQVCIDEGVIEKSSAEHILTLLA